MDSAEWNRLSEEAVRVAEDILERTDHEKVWKTVRRVVQLLARAKLDRKETHLLLATIYAMGDPPPQKAVWIMAFQHLAHHVETRISEIQKPS